MKRSSVPGALPGAGLEAAMARIASLNGARVTAGIQQAQGSVGSLAVIAASNHYGTHEIPARPWLSRAVSVNRARWSTLAGRVVKARGTGGGTGAVELRQLAVVMVGDCKESLLDGPWPPNSARTIAMKGSDQPLIDTGRLNQSQRAQVELPDEQPIVVG